MKSQVHFIFYHKIRCNKMFDHFAFRGPHWHQVAAAMIATIILLESMMMSNSIQCNIWTLPCTYFISITHPLSETIIVAIIASENCFHYVTLHHFLWDSLYHLLRPGCRLDSKHRVGHDQKEGVKHSLEINI